jgi:hypothetical protein
MHEPVTKLDTRYSEQDGVVMPWEETWHVLAHSHGVLALCIHVLEGPVDHHVARFGGARRGETIPSTQPGSVCFLKNAASTSVLPLWFFSTCRCILLEVMF